MVDFSKLNSERTGTNTKVTAEALKDVIEGTSSFNVDGDGGGETKVSSTQTAGEEITIDMGDSLTLLDVLVDTSDSASLSLSVSETGDFTGEGKYTKH